MSLEVGLTSKTPYLDAVSTSLPSILSDLLLSFDIYSLDKLDTLVRFCAGCRCPVRIAGHTGAWESGQLRLQAKLAQLEPSMSGLKRQRMEQNDGDGAQLTNGSGTSGVANKKPKLAVGVEDGIQDTEPLYTLHSISITAPIRKKVDISITREAIRLTNPTNGNLEARIPVTTFKRAFIVSNLGKNKNKEQWAVTLISVDNFDKKGDAASQAQLTFNVDKSVPGGKDGFKTTSGTVNAEQQSHSKGEDTLPLLQRFLSHLPSNVDVVTVDKVAGSSAQAFKSRADQPYVDAYLGAKEGSLCFLPQGILWANSRPCEFYALEDLAPDSDTPGLGGVKTLSATGRTFSVFVRRRRERDAEDQDQDEEDGDAEDNEGAEQGEETEFQMIDGRELENVNAWIRKYRGQFGKGRPDLHSTTTQTPSQVDVKGKGKGKARAEPQDTVVDDEDSDASDEDYAAPSESDGGEPSSDSDSENSDEEGEGVETAEEEEEEAEEEEELDPARHPLLRPGAVPKMSKAAMEAALGLVTQDVVGSAGDADDDGSEDEVDELE